MPAGEIVMSGVHAVPENYTKDVSTVAYKVPDIEGTVTILLFNASNPKQNIGCFSSSISNGLSTDVSAVKFLTIGLAAAALVISGVSSAANSSPPTAAPAGPHAPVIPSGGELGGPAASGPGTNVAAGGFHAPGFTEFFSVLQSIAISGMYSVNYPESYRKFTQNVAWSTGVITWSGMQESIDNFRGRTGGNLTASSYRRLQQTTLIMGNQTNQVVSTDIMKNNQTSKSVNHLTRRALQALANVTNTNTTTQGNESTSKKYVEIVSGIKAYVESMSIPSTNTFMTMLIWWAIIVGICVVGIMSFKLALELWCLKSKNSTKFSGFRQRYLTIMNTMLVRLITILYGVWVLYCLYQFKISDSWGVQLIAGLTLGIFSLVIIGYGLRICFLARKAKKEQKLEFLFERKSWIRKYGLFYDQFKVKFWWAFIPVFMCSFGRNAFLALGYGNGLVQIIGQLVVDTLLCLFFAIWQPFNTKMGNILNLAIQAVRVISLIFLMLFTVQASLNRIAVTGVGMAAIVVQAILAVVLALLIFINAVSGLINMMRSDKKKKKRKEEKEKKKQEQQQQRGEIIVEAETSDGSNTLGSLSSRSRIEAELRDEKQHSC